jgi:hypothetical protein
MRGRVVGSSIVFSVAIAGCALLGGFDFNDYTGADGGREDDGEAAAATGDAMGDQPAPGADGAPEADATSPPDAMCSQAYPLLCLADAGGRDGFTFFADFDEKCLPIPVHDENDPALYELSCDKWVSPPASLHLQAPSLGGFDGFLRLERSLAPSFPLHAHVELDLFVASFASGTQTVAFGLGADKVGNMGSGFGFYLFPDTTGSLVKCYVQDYQPPGVPDQSQDCAGGMPLQKWSHLVFDLTRTVAGAPMHLTVGLGGTGLLFDSDLRAFVDGPNFHFDLDIGTYEESGSHWELYFDNVSVLDQ